MIDNFRRFMKDYGIDYYVLTDSDPHMSEYTNDYYKRRTKVSGFTGSNGTLVIGLNDAHLFTDGRYFIQAEKELKGTGIKLMKSGEKDVPSVRNFISDLSQKGYCVCTDSNLISYNDYINFGFKDNTHSDTLYNEVYCEVFGEECSVFNPSNECEQLPLNICGESVQSKLSKIRNNMKIKNIDVFVSSNLASNMWILNIRGKAIPCNPLLYCHSVITMDKAFLFVFDAKNFLSLGTDIEILEYSKLDEMLSDLNKGNVVAFDYSNTNANIGNLLQKAGLKTVDYECNVLLMKSIKNETEINNMRKYFAKDNKIVKDFIDFVKNEDLKEYDEYSLGLKLDGMRLSDPECLDLSFDTISACGSNAAMMHYEATKDNKSFVKQNNLYLVDSGGQWIGATTDITRTVSIGKPTYQMKHDYTKVLRGLLHLQNAVFIEGCTGVNLDILAREPIWEEGDDYKCGTGHGIGYRLCVHEGPNSIRTKSTAKDAVLKPGMIMSDEPGIYRKGEYGIRLENVLLVKEKCVNDDGRFLCFECLTYVPFDKDLILEDEMTEKEIIWLNNYMSKC